MSKTYVRKSSRTFGTDSNFDNAVFWRVHKTAKSDCYLLHVLLSVRPSAWNLAPTGQIFIKFAMSIFRKSVHKIQV